MVSRLIHCFSAALRISMRGVALAIQWTMCCWAWTGERAWCVGWGSTSLGFVVVLIALVSVRSSAAAWLGRRGGNVSKGTGDSGCL